MLRNNSTLRREARAALKGNWKKAVLLTLLYMIIVTSLNVITPSSSYLINFICMILITAPLGFGLNVAFLKFSRGEEYRYDDLFWGFRNYSKVLSTGTLATTYTYLWMLLLIVPGIIKGYSYSLTPYLVYDKGLTNNAAIEESMRLMKGHKMRLFSLDFGYCLLMIVLLITIVGWLWVLPKWQVARANLYNDLIAQDTASQTAI